MAVLDPSELEDVIRRALAEDLGEAGDVTSRHIVRTDQPGRARIVAKSGGVLAGVPVADQVFRTVDRGLQVGWRASDGDELTPGLVVAEIEGRARAILAAERVSLNFLQHLAGVATLTAAYVARCAPYRVRVLCTRKTLPGLRSLQRYAVLVGGGSLHRAGLFDAILVKTNHQRLSAGVAEAVRRARGQPQLEVEVEVTNLEELEQAIGAGAQRVLLDNARLDLIAEAVERARGRVFLEVSGGIDLEGAEAIARLGPDAISVGRITHSAPAVDFSLQVLGPPGAAPRTS